MARRKPARKKKILWAGGALREMRSPLLVTLGEGLHSVKELVGSIDGGRLPMTMVRIAGGRPVACFLFLPALHRRCSTFLMTAPILTVKCQVDC